MAISYSYPRNIPLRKLVIISFSTAGVTLGAIFIIFTSSLQGDDYNVWSVPFQSPPPFGNGGSDTIYTTTQHHGPVSASLPTDAFRDIQVVLKTGAAETYTTLLTHLLTVTSIVPTQDLFIFSDVETTLGPYTIHDALATLPAAYKAANPEFETYIQQKEALLAGRPIAKSPGGWKLDKHKFLPMLSRTWALTRHSGMKKFYVFIETDTFVFWETLLPFLSRFSGAAAADEPLYLGSPVSPTVWGHSAFAHGGSGFVLSAGAMRRLMRGEEKYGAAGAHQFGVDLSRECCGDAVLSDVLLSRGIKIRGYWPLFNGEMPSSVAFGGEKGLWCEPLGTLHHLGEMAELWEWRNGLRRQGKDGPLLYADLFPYVFPNTSAMSGQRENANAPGFKHVVPSSSIKTAEACKMACRRKTQCFHWQFHGRVCELTHSIQLGGEKRGSEENGDDGERWASGFNEERVWEYVRNKTCGVLETLGVDDSGYRGI